MTVAQLEKYIFLEPYRLLKLFDGTNENVMTVWNDVAWYAWGVKVENN